VLDTSPLQALYRGGVLGRLRAIFGRTMLPLSVADETRWWLAQDRRRAALAPSLDTFPELDVRVVDGATVRAVVERLHVSHVLRTKPRTAAPRSLVAVHGGKIYAWSDGSSPEKAGSLTYDVTDLEVVVLARELAAVAVVDDSKALKAAAELDVRTMTTLEVLEELVARGVIPDASPCLEKIEATGYHPARRGKSKK
jgi:predicted nucleic acid-binding protein